MRHKVQIATSAIFSLFTFDLCFDRQAFSFGSASGQLRASFGSGSEKPDCGPWLVRWLSVGGPKEKSTQIGNRYKTNKVEIMARLRNGIFGGISGKIGDVIGYIRYGKAYVKMKTLKPKKKGSPAQLAERRKFNVVNTFINSMTEFVRIGFALDAANKPHSANSAAKSYQMKNALAGEYPSLEIDYPRALLCRGKIDPPVDVTVAVLTNGLQFSWELSQRTEVYKKRSRVMLLVYAPVLGKSFYSLSGARILERTDFMELPTEFKGQLLHAYASFHRDDEMEISNSTYAGTINY